MQNKQNSGRKACNNCLQKAIISFTDDFELNPSLYPPHKINTQNKLT